MLWTACGALYQVWLMSQLQSYLEMESLVAGKHNLINRHSDNCATLYMGLLLKQIQLMQNIIATELTQIRCLHPSVAFTGFEFVP